MSRHLLPARPDRAGDLDVVRGWDGPLQTFFLQVSRPDATGDDDRILVWMGTDWRALDDLGPVLAAAASWAIVPPDLAEQLAAERDADRRARPPAVLTALIVGRS